MNVLERIRSKFLSYRLLVKCRRDKLYCKMERERDRRERERGEGERRERDIERKIVKGRGIDRERE